MAHLTTLYRGEQTPFSSLGRSNLMKGRWFTPNPEFARGYANYPGGVVRSVDATASELAKAKKFKNYLKYAKNLGARISPNPEVMIAPRSLLNRASINWGQTLKHNLDVSRLAAQLYGPKILEKGIGALRVGGMGALRVAGLTNPVGAAAMSAWAAPKAIDYLTKRDADATETSLFGLNLQDLEDKAVAYDAGEKIMPEATLDDWGSPFGNVPGDEEADTAWENFQRSEIMKDLFQKRRNIPGTPIVPVGDVSAAPAEGITNIVATGDGGGGFSPQLDPGSPGSAPSWRGATAAREAAGKSVAGPGFGRGAYWAKGGLIDKPLSGRSRDI